MRVATLVAVCVSACLVCAASGLANTQEQKTASPFLNYYSHLPGLGRILPGNAVASIKYSNYGLDGSARALEGSPGAATGDIDAVLDEQNMIRAQQRDVARLKSEVEEADESIARWKRRKVDAEQSLQAGRQRLKKLAHGMIEKLQKLESNIEGEAKSGGEGMSLTSASSSSASSGGASKPASSGSKSSSGSASTPSSSSSKPAFFEEKFREMNLRRQQAQRASFLKALLQRKIKAIAKQSVHNDDELADLSQVNSVLKRIKSHLGKKQ